MNEKNVNTVNDGGALALGSMETSKNIPTLKNELKEN